MEYISYNMGKRDVPDIYAWAQGPQISGKSLLPMLYNLYSTYNTVEWASQIIVVASQHNVATYIAKAYMQIFFSSQLFKSPNTLYRYRV